jgi:redox-sensitive bicupin YhaK (pirin superfamily)
MGFRGLRVINEDRVQPGKGFGTHPHDNMEIISYVLEGSLQHRDSMGNGSIIRPNDVQRMSAGTGITHSEFNPSPDQQVHFLQIWLLPAQRNIQPGYEQKTFSEVEKQNRMRLVASPDGRDGSITIHANANVYAGVLRASASASLALAPERHAWVQLVRGKARVNAHDLKAGDGAALSMERAVEVQSLEQCEILVFDLA